MLTLQFCQAARGEPDLAKQRNRCTPSLDWAENQSTSTRPI